MSVFEKLLKSAENEYATKVIDGIPAGDVDTYIDTGSYAFNALLSGTLYGGVPNNKIMALAGESSTGKTYFALGMCKKFLDDNSEGVILYFDTEQAVTSNMIEDRGMDSSRVAIFTPPKDAIVTSST